MEWTTPDDIRKQVQKMWDKGTILVSIACAESLFPLELTIRKPSSREFSDHFSDVRTWIANLSDAAKHYQVRYQKVNNRIIGVNDIPSGIRIDRLSDAVSMIGKQKQTEIFSSMIALTLERQPILLEWLVKRPLRALEIAKDWPALLSVVDWMMHHPRPAIYLRQMDLSGIHTKLVEAYRSVLSELFDIVLPKEQIDLTATGQLGFCQRYGFLQKPNLVRFRVLDFEVLQLATNTTREVLDITVTADAFASLSLAVNKVYVTENEINFLAFPRVPRAIVVFGSGYGFDTLAGASWLHLKEICYWGDMDTHGFAILNQLRSVFPHVTSLLMDEKTLLAHKALWGKEEKAYHGELSNLTTDEWNTYNSLRFNHYGKQVRLEQERIGYPYLLDAIKPD